MSDRLRLPCIDDNEDDSHSLAPEARARDECRRELVQLRASNQRLSADLLEWRRTETSLRRSEMELSLINRIEEAFLTISGDGVYSAVLEIVQERLESPHGIFGYLAGNGDLIIPSLTRGIFAQCQMDERTVVFPPSTWGDSLWGRAIRERRPFFENREFRVPVGHVAVNAFLTVPLVFDGRTIGLMSVANRPGGYAEPHAELLGRVAAQTAPILHARRSAKESEGRFQAIFETVTDAMALVDPDTRRLTLVNRAFCEMLGVSAEEAICLSIGDFYPPSVLPRVLEAFARAMRGEDCAATDVVTLRSNGSVLYTDLGGSPIDLGGRRYLLASIRDVTERRAMRASLAQADRLSTMGMLAAGVAHEINNPLASVLFNVESLASELPAIIAEDKRSRAEGMARPGPSLVSLGTPATALDVREVGTRLGEALEGIRRIREITHRLDTFSRVEQGDPVPVDVSEALDHAVGMIHNQARFRARFVKDYGRTPAVRAVQGKLAQVFLNLLANAVHAIDEGDPAANEICVHSWARDGQVFVEIGDTGRGIPLEIRDRVFEPFFTTQPVGEGSGLGLAICKSLVTSFGGQITFESECGKGTRFLVALPACEGQTASPAPSPAPAATDPEKSHARGRVLIVDDDEAVLRVLGRILASQHELVMVTSGEEAQSVLGRDERFELLLFDLMMPGVSGIQLHRWLADRRPGLAARVVFMTGGVFSPVARDYLETVPNFRIEKPFNPAQVRKVAADFVRAAGRPAP